MTTPGPVVLILVSYLLFIFKIGPSYMKNKEPYKLTTVLILYNIFQVVFSAYLVKKYFKQLYRHGLAPRSCLINDESHRKEIILVLWLYFIAKIIELLDTVFFVLRKKDKQITFLHVYHHCIMMMASWAYIKYWPSELLLIIGGLNSLVHVFMYTYYGLAALGPKATKYIFWKRHMTKMQLVQFVCILIHYAIAIQRSECPHEGAVALFFSFNNAFVLLLFVHFYWKNYTSGKKTISFDNICKLSEKES
ncbi:elongation of very long chain fatty acids protein 7-like [Melitaea cinxia]|uniref:elongation of very long chain fatty acids protein 7-like n=1 Tax=Melitaea cinxia TaxID=113334 RepID=UPI001E273D41|nr:elongation of very long chain fatty acids protein 7-like [Melitaea cinxia]